MASGAKDRLIKLWDPSQGKNIANLLHHTNAINHIKFSLCGNYLFSTGKDQLIRVVDLRQMKEIIQLPGHFTEIVKLAVHPTNNQLLVSADIEGKVCLWNPIYGYPVDMQIHEGGFNLPGVSFINQGEKIVTLSHDKSLKVWQIVSK